MLEILYDKATKGIRAWNADGEVLGNLKPKEGQEVVILPIDPPDFESDVYYVDLLNKKVIGNLSYAPTVPFDPKAEINCLKARIEKLEKR